VVRRFERLRRVAPERIDVYEVPAIALIEDSRPDEAEVLIAEGMRRRSEDGMMWRAAARIADRLGDHDEAIRRWEALRSRFPADQAGFLQGAEALARANRGKEAAALIRQARDFFPGNKEIAEAATRLIPPGIEEPTT
jgi:predicted Zn-dependent protease